MTSPISLNLAKASFTYSSGEFHSLTTGAQLKYLFDRLNRPLRVCGMVKNEGEPEAALTGSKTGREAFHFRSSNLHKSI